MEFNNSLVSTMPWVLLLCWKDVWVPCTTSVQAMPTSSLVSHLHRAYTTEPIPQNISCPQVCSVSTLILPRNLFLWLPLIITLDLLKEIKCYMPILAHNTDTAFMFITGGIILVKVYQNRHPNIQANAFIAFFAFAVIILFTVIGIVSQVSY